MSTQLRELTRTCVLSGVSATKWESLVRHWISRNTTNLPTPEEVGKDIWTALRPLLTTHTFEQNLPLYVPVALSSGLLPLHVLSIGLLTQPFVGSSTSSLAELSLLDGLIQRVTFSLLSRGPPPQALLQVPSEASLEDVINAVHSAIELVKMAFSVPPEALLGPNPLSGTLTNNSAQLLVNALNSINRVDTLSLNEATELLTHLADIEHFPLPATLIQQLAEWNSHISYHRFRLQSGDQKDLSASTRSSQPVIFYKPFADGEVQLPEGSELSCSVVLQRLGDQIPGAGSDINGLSELLALFQSLDMKAAVFCRSIVLAALHLVSLSYRNIASRSTPLMASFVLGRLPRLMARLEGIAYETSPAEDFRAALSSSLAFSLADRHLVASCSGREAVANNSEEFSESQREDFIFAHRLVHSFATAGLLKDDYSSLVSLAPHFPTDRFELDKIATAALDEGLTLEEYLSSKLDSGAFEPGSVFSDDVASSFTSHASFVDLVSKSMTSACSSGDLAQAATIAQMLHSNMELLEVVFLHTSVPKLVIATLACLTTFDFSSTSDAHTALMQYGDMVLFVQICAYRFKLRPYPGASKLMFPARISTPLSCLAPEDRVTAQRWMHSIFSPMSEGIDDELQRNTEPMTLLQLAPTILVEAFNAIAEDDNREVLLGGASFFVGDLLKWTLPGVLFALISAIDREGATSGIHLEALHRLITSPKCPLPALQISGFSILRLIAAPFVQRLAGELKRDLTELRIVVCKALRVPDDFGLDPGPSTATHADYSRMLVHSILTMPPATPTLLPLRRLASCSSQAILSALFQELATQIVIDRDGVSRLSKSTAALTAAIVAMPRGPSGLSLSPYLLQIFTPSILARLPDTPIVPDTLETLTALIGTVVMSLRSRIQAHKAAGAYIFRNDNLDVDAVKSEVGESYDDDFDSLVSEFVRWCETAKADPTRVQLLHKLQSRPEYSKHFITTT